MKTLPAILSVAEAKAAGGKFVTEPLTLKRGDADAALATAPKRLQGQMEIGRPGTFLSRRSYLHRHSRRKTTR